VNKYS